MLFIIDHWGHGGNGWCVGAHDYTGYPDQWLLYHMLHPSTTDAVVVSY